MKPSNTLTLDVSERQPFADGHSFGSMGAYERIVATAHFQVDPRAECNGGVVDLDVAPRNGEGAVEFDADVFILRPLGGGNGRLFFDLGNRGNKRALQFFNDAPASNDPRTLADAGNGFLMRRGYTVAWGAWQGDLWPGSGRMLLNVPKIGTSETPVTGKVRTEFVAEQSGIVFLPLSGAASTRSYPAVSLDTSRARLTRRRYAWDEREPVPASEWQFARVEGGVGLDAQGAEIAIVPSDTHIYIPAGFEPGVIYELVYDGREPLVLGLGHVAVRDLVSFLRFEGADASGTPNPLGKAGSIERAYAWGRSQTGRYLRDFVYNGYNADAAGRKVFDGVLPHVSGGGLMWMNHRFANVITPAGQQHEDHFNIADRFPFSYASSTDHLTGHTDAICKRPDSDPLVIHTQTATEYWQRRGSLVHTDTQGNDLPQPANVRIYLWASSQHFADPRMGQPGFGNCQHRLNAVTTSMLFRAVLDAMDAWATSGKAPPHSRVPLRSDNTLVDYGTWRRQFPIIPGASVPSGPADLPLLDFGERAGSGLLDNEPPRVVDRDGYTILVPAVDADGNDIPGVRAPMVCAPLGTYMGWNVRARGHGIGATHMFTGGYIPLPFTTAEQRATGDPRQAIEARYPAPEDYVRAIERAARELVEARLMLDEDVQRSVDAAHDYSTSRHVR